MVITQLEKKSGAKLSLTRSFRSRHPNFCHQREMVNSCEKVREVKIFSSHQTGINKIVSMWCKQPCHFEGTMQWNAVHSLMRGKITRQRNLSEMPSSHGCNRVELDLRDWFSWAAKCNMKDLQAMFS